MHPEPARRARLCQFLLLGWLVLGTACSWGVPADPGKNARVRAQPTASSSVPVATAQAGGESTLDPRAGALYAQRCSQCHELIPPPSLAANEWRMALRKYGPRAGLFGAERAQVEAWLIAQAPR